MRTVVLKPPDSHQHRAATRTDMDLNFTEAELAFRAEVRDWVHTHLPVDIPARSAELFRPGPAVQRHLFEEECALACAPRIVPFGPVMVAPVIMAFGTPEPGSL